MAVCPRQYILRGDMFGSAVGNVCSLWGWAGGGGGWQTKGLPWAAHALATLVPALFNFWCFEELGGQINIHLKWHLGDRYTLT